MTTSHYSKRKRVNPIWILFLVWMLFLIFSCSSAAAPRVYLKNSLPPIRQELWVETTPGVNLKLSPELEEHRNVVRFLVTPDGQKVVYLADIASDNVIELFSVSISGSTSVKVNSGVPFDWDIPGNYLISLDSRWVIFMKSRAALGAANLYSASIAGGNEIRLSQIVSPWNYIQSFSLISGDRVRFNADVDGDGEYLWYVIPLRGGTIRTEIFSNGFESGNTGVWQ